MTEEGRAMVPKEWQVIQHSWGVRYMGKVVENDNRQFRQRLDYEKFVGQAESVWILSCG